MNTRAEMERVKKELEVGHEWLGIEQDQAELQRATLELVRSQKKMQREHDFCYSKSKEKQNSKDKLLNWKPIAKQMNSTSQIKKSVKTFEPGSQLCMWPTQLETATRPFHWMVQQRKVERHVTAQDHIDNLQNIENQSEVAQKEQEIRHQSEQTELKHQQDLENQTVDNDLNQQSKIADNRRTQDVLDAQNNAIIADIELETHIKVKQCRARLG